MRPFHSLASRESGREAAIRPAHDERATAMRAALARLAAVMAFPFRVAARVWAAWRRRVEIARALTELRGWSDHQLADIGIRREQIEEVVGAGRPHRDINAPETVPPVTGRRTAVAPRPRGATRRAALRCARPRVSSTALAACC